MASDTPKEPRKHTKMYDETVMRLIGGDTNLKQLVGEINSLMFKFGISPAEMQRIVRFVCERHRWLGYAVQQDAKRQEPKPEIPEPNEMYWDDDDDGEGSI